jgi:hypothetical protein
MRELKVDAALRGKLNGLTEPVEFYDESGRRVGSFLPTAIYEDLQFMASVSELSNSREELERLLRESGRPSVSEIWRSLLGSERIASPAQSNSLLTDSFR